MIDVKRMWNGTLRTLSIAIVTSLLAASTSAPAVSADGPAVVLSDSLDIAQQGTTVAVHLLDFTNLFAATLVLVYPNNLVEVVDTSFGDMPLAYYGPVEKPAVNHMQGTVTQSLWIPATYSFSDHVLFTVTFRPLRRACAQSSPYFRFTVGADTVFYSPDGRTRIAPDTSGITDRTATILSSTTTKGVQDDSLDNNPINSSNNNVKKDIDANLPTTPSERDTKQDTQDAMIAPHTLAVSPSQVLPNQEVTVSANICNNGEERGSKTVSLMVNGVAEQSQSVAVSGGACQQVIFKVSRAVPGTYQVAIDGMTGQFSVLAPRTVTNNVPSQQQTGLGTTGIIAIIAVIVVLIVGLIMVFKRD